jgi:hypothetical protein
MRLIINKVTKQNTKLDQKKVELTDLIRVADIILHRCNDIKNCIVKLDNDYIGKSVVYLDRIEIEVSTAYTDGTRTETLQTMNKSEKWQSCVGFIGFTVILVCLYIYLIN